MKGGNLFSVGLLVIGKLVMCWVLVLFSECIKNMFLVIVFWVLGKSLIVILKVCLFCCFVLFKLIDVFMIIGMFVCVWKSLE